MNPKGEIDMLNSVILIGRLAQDIKLRQIMEGKQVTTMTLAVMRPFKNYDGQYDTDFIKVSLWDTIAKQAQEYLSKGQLVAVHGRLQVNQMPYGEEKKLNMIELIGEKLIFLSPREIKEDGDNETLDI